VVDDIGMLPAGADAAEAFYRVVDAATERRSLAVTSNIHPSGFDTIMPKSIATGRGRPVVAPRHLVATEGPSCASKKLSPAPVSSPSHQASREEPHRRQQTKCVTLRQPGSGRGLHDDRRQQPNA